MAASRVLVVEDESRASRNLGLTVFNREMAFEYETLEKVSERRVDLSPFRAVAVSMDCAGSGLIEALGTGLADDVPVFLFQGEPPLHSVARWLALTTPPPEGEERFLTNRLLSESLEYYSLASLYQQCLRIMTAQDEEKLLAQITDTFIHEVGAESCVIWLASPLDPDEMKITSVRGLNNIGQEGSRFFLSQTDWAELIWKGKPFAPPYSGGALDRGAEDLVLFVPLTFNESPIGLVKLGERMNGKGYGERARFVARIIAEYASSSIRNVDRMSRVEKVSLRDSETSAYSPAFLKDYLEKELYKSGRFRRPLSIILFVAGNFAQLMEQTRESVVIGALAGVVEEIRKALRDSDLIARIDTDRFCIVLPETDTFGTMLAIRRLRKVIRGKSAISFLGGEFRLQSFFLPATFPRDGKTYPDLKRAAEEGYIRQQRSPLSRLRLQEKAFWDAFDILVGKSSFYDRLASGEEVPYFSRIRRDLGRNGHFMIPRDSFQRVVEAVAQDIHASKDERGLAIAAGPRPEVFRQIFLSFGPEPPPSSRIYLIGRSGTTRFDGRNILYVSAEDERLATREILLYLKENGAYGLFAADRGEDVCGFNSADEWLVESMMEKIQDLYLLQGHF
jgi:diguanylate cyclase (GGDEF)-like protein